MCRQEYLRQNTRARQVLQPNMNTIVLRIDRSLIRQVDHLLQAWRAFITVVSPVATAVVTPSGQQPSLAQASLDTMLRTDTPTIRGLSSARAVLDDLRDVIVEIAEHVPADKVAQSDAVLSSFNRLVASAGRRQILERRARNRALFERRLNQLRGNAAVVQLVANCKAILERQRELNPRM